MASTINASTSPAAIIQTADGTGILALQTASTTAVTIDASQNVGIGVTNPSSFDGNAQKLVVGNTSGNNGISVVSGTANQGYLMFSGGYGSSYAYNGYITYSQANNFMAFGTNAGTERMRIDSSGVLMLGKTSQNTNTTGIEIQQDGFTGITRASNTPLYVNRKTTTGNMVSFYSDATNVGNISNNGTNTTYGTSSDYRLKDNIIPMTDALDTVSKLKPVTYKWKSTNQAGQGFIAHELQEIVPDCVVGEKDALDENGQPIYQNIDTSFLVATLTAAIQEQQALITSLTARITAMEGA